MMYKNTPIVRRGVVLIFVFFIVKTGIPKRFASRKATKETKGIVHRVINIKRVLFLYLTKKHIKEHNEYLLKCTATLFAKKGIP